MKLWSSEWRRWNTKRQKLSDQVYPLAYQFLVDSGCDRKSFKKVIVVSVLYIQLIISDRDGCFPRHVLFRREKKVQRETSVWHVSRLVFRLRSTSHLCGMILKEWSSGGLIFSDKFIQLVTYLPSDAMYGWGENVHLTLKVSTRKKPWPFFF